MIIFYCGKNIYENFIHNSINELLQWIDCNYDEKFLNPENLNREYCLSKYGQLPNVILILETFKNIKHVKEVYPDTKIVIYTNDIHYWTEEDKNIKYNTYLYSDYIIAYYNKFKRFYNLDKKIFHINHNCCSIFKRDKINLNPIKKIFFYGSTESKNYPLRNEFIDNMNKKYEDRLVIKSHPGYIFKDKEEAVRNINDTAHELYRYFCAFTCGLFPKFEIEENSSDDFYLIGKFFEIMGNGALLLCNDYKVMDQLDKLGYYRNVHYLQIDSSNFDQVISYIFDDRNMKKLNDIRERAHKHTLENYYSVKMNRKLNEFLSKLNKGEYVEDCVVDSK